MPLDEKKVLFHLCSHKYIYYLYIKAPSFKMWFKTNVKQGIKSLMESEKEVDSRKKREFLFFEIHFYCF